MTAIGQDLRMTGHRRKSHVVARNRLSRPVEAQQRIAPVDERADMARAFRQRVVVVRKRFVNAAEFETGVGEIVEDFRMIRRKQQRAAIARDGLIKASCRMKREPKI